MMSSAQVHAQLGSAWPAVLAQLGIAEEFLRLKKAGPCPACGGTDRYVFDNRRGRGDYFCRGCGAGDGFTLLQRVHGWKFTEALQRVSEAAGLAEVRAPTSEPRRPQAFTAAAPAQPGRAEPTRRAREILRNTCDLADLADAREYLASRALWPAPAQCTLRGHASVEYWQERKRIGRFPALVATVRDVTGELVSVHVTYLQDGRKLADHEPRKILSPLAGRSGCATRLVPLEGDTLGIAEGVETALAAQALHQVPTWAALNTWLLTRFEPPPEVRQLVVLADRDAPGLEAAARLMEHLQGRVHLEFRVPRPPAKDWADVLMERGA
jgi:putative DNA primase/helicase